MNFFQQHLKRGYLKKQNPNFEQILKQLKRAYKDLKTAKRTKELLGEIRVFIETQNPQIHFEF